jgi:hypothetical protein
MMLFISIVAPHEPTSLHRPLYWMQADVFIFYCTESDKCANSRTKQDWTKNVELGQCRRLVMCAAGSIKLLFCCDAIIHPFNPASSQLWLNALVFTG